ncbi:hypothetical protein I6I99_09820 [Sphingobacterium multivorum]|nr:hypothetical protein [Sphingobacterium multivorum]QQT32830.1 hypothetical protein I6I99_09820 [Sphingobacterium multivorum]
MANQFLIKETMQSMKTLDSTEIAALESGTYNGVQLLGYREKGDTPAPIIYHYVHPVNDPNPGPDNGGSVIAVSDIKLKHTFVGEVDVRYFGASENVESSNSIQTVNNLCESNGKLTLVGYGDFKVDLPVYLTCNCNLANATFRTTKVSSGALLTISNGARLENKNIKLPTVVNALFTTSYANIQSTGVSIRAITMSKIMINRISGFKIGCYMFSDLSFQDDITWNDFYFKGCINNETQWKMQVDNEGYINQNTFRNFMSSKYSATDRENDKQLVIVNNATTTTRMDNNTFLNCSFEQIMERVDNPDYSIVDIHGATNSLFLGCRYETYLKGNKILVSGGRDNIFLGGYGLRVPNFLIQNNAELTIEAGSQFYSTGRTTNINGDINLNSGHRYKTDGSSSGVTMVGSVYPLIIDNSQVALSAVPRIYLQDGQRFEQQFFLNTNGTNTLASRDIMTVTGNGLSTRNLEGIQNLRINNKNVQYADYLSNDQFPINTQRGTMFFSSTDQIPKWWNGSSWVNAVPNANTSKYGIVKQSTAVSNVMTADSNKSVLTDATSSESAIALVNDLKSKYNQAVDLLQNLKNQLNTKLNADRNSGQQAM